MNLGKHPTSKLRGRLRRQLEYTLWNSLKRQQHLSRLGSRLNLQLWISMEGPLRAVLGEVSYDCSKGNRRKAA